MAENIAKVALLLNFQYTNIKIMFMALYTSGNQYKMISLVNG